MTAQGTQVPYGNTSATLPDGPAARWHTANLRLLDRLDRLAAAANLKKSRDSFGVLATSETEAGTSESEE